MYAWIWRRLPFGLAGKLTGSVLIILMAGATLWLWVFPWLEPLLPFDDVRVESPLPGELGVPGVPDGSGTTGPPTPSPTVPDDPFAIPYSTATNSSPSPTQ